MGDVTPGGTNGGSNNRTGKVTLIVITIGVVASVWRSIFAPTPAAVQAAEIKAMAAELQAVRSELREANRRLEELRRDRQGR